MMTPRAQGASSGPAPGVLYLHCLPTRGELPIADERACLALLDTDERERNARFVLPARRREDLVTRAFVRSLLGHHVGVPAEALAFETNAWGRPSLLRPAEPALSFNLAHADGLVVCLLACGTPASAAAPAVIGVDVENVVCRRPPLEVAADFFASEETAALGALPRMAQGRRFFELWTLKESYIKARGMGLAIPLDGFAFDLSAGIHIAFRPEVDREPDAWQFALVEPTPEHLVALAVRRGANAPDFALELFRHESPLEPLTTPAGTIEPSGAPSGGSFIRRGKLR